MRLRQIGGDRRYDSRLGSASDVFNLECDETVPRGAAVWAKAGRKRVARAPNERPSRSAVAAGPPPKPPAATASDAKKPFFSERADGGERRLAYGRHAKPSQSVNARSWK